MGWLITLSIIITISISIYVYNRYIQRKHALLITHPLTGPFRYFFDWVFQYIRTHLHKDWEERPFSRLTRKWIRQSALDKSNYISFGSEQNPNEPGTIIFANSTFPILSEHTESYPGKWIGEHSCENPYFAKSFFNITGMSYGSIGSTAIESMSKGINQIDAWINTGEGGLSKHHLHANNIVFQIGTAKFGCGTVDGLLDQDKLSDLAKIDQIKMFEIKLSQGAKPGSGGILPANKVTDEIAKARGIPKGVAAISPNRHREIHDIDSLIEIVHSVREITKKPVGIKLVVGGDYFLEDYFEKLLEKSYGIPDFITVDGTEAGTGAAPESLAEYVGMPLAQALIILVDRLVEYGLKDRIRVIASGKLATPDKVAWALCVGADFVVTGRGFLLALGCIQAMKCATGRCPKGITTTNPKLTRAIDPSLKSVRIANYAYHVIQEVEAIAHSCGLKNSSEFQRKHARIVTGIGKSKKLSNEFPYPKQKDN